MIEEKTEAPMFGATRKPPVDITPAPDRSTADDRQRTAAVALVARLTALGLEELVTDVRAELERASALRAEFANARADVRDDYATLLDAVISGETTPADALRLLGPITVAEARTRSVHGSRFSHLEAEVLEAVATEAVRAARRAADRVHDELSDRAASIVAAAVEVAGQLTDIRAYASAIERATQHQKWNNESRCLVGWPRFDLSSIPSARLGALGALRNCASELERLHDALVPLVVIEPDTTSVLYLSPGTAAETSYLQRWTPQELHLAVAAELGWQPGLWRSPHVHNDMRPDFGDLLERDISRSAVSSVADQQSAGAR